MSVPVIKPDDNDMFSLPFIVATAKRYWIRILAAALLGGGVAYMLSVKQGYLFEKSMRVMLRDDKQKGSQAADFLLADMGFKTEGSNLANESYVMRSTEMMERVVRDLALNISYWEKKDIRQVDLYHSSPINVSFEGMPEPSPCALQVTPLNEREFSLVVQERGGKETTLRGNYGVPVNAPGHAEAGNKGGGDDGGPSFLVQATPLLKAESMGRTVFVEKCSVQQAARGLVGRLTVEQADSKDSSLLELTIRLSHPKKAEDVLNHLVNVYNDESLKEKQTAFKRAGEFITRRIGTLGGELGGIDRDIIDYKRNGRIVKDMGTTLEASFRKVQEIGMELLSARTELTQARMLAKLLMERRHERDMIAATMGIKDAGITRQIELFNEQFLQYKKLSASAGRQNPMVSTLAVGMKDMRESIVQAIDNYISMLEVRKGELEKERDSLNRDLSEMASREASLAPLLREQKVMEELYLMLLGKKEENSLALATTEPGARILEHASGADAAVAPRSRLMTAGGLAAGGGLCLACCMLLRALNTKVRDRMDLMDGQTSLTVAGELPLVREHKSGDLVVVNDRSLAEEAFLMLGSQIDLLLSSPGEGGQGNVLVLTSTKEGEGKTFTALNLAAACVRFGKRVLLVDGDLRKAGLSAAYGSVSARGLAWLLRHPEADPATVVRTDERVPGLDVVMAGPLPRNSIALLNQLHMDELLRYWRAQYDLVIIDGCPYGMVADASLLTRRADLVLYVIRSGMIGRQSLSSIQALMDRDDVRAGAVILNGVDFKHSWSSYYEGYKTYAYGRK